jgi:hypothetical protein
MRVAQASGSEDRGDETKQSYRYLKEVAARAATDQQVAASYPAGDLVIGALRPTL